MSNFENKIKVTELRIGNILQLANNPSLRKEVIGEVIILSINDIKLIDDGSTHFEPIPLTEDWLLKLGFSSEEYRDKSKHIGLNFGQTDFTLVKPGSSGFEHIKHFGFEFDAGGWPRLKQFEYVHELQNFFYCYSGEELEVKI